MKFIESFRQFLEKYKIFFEILIVPLLAGIIAYKANTIAEQQTEILKVQTAISQQQIMPKFEVSAKQIYNPEEQKANDEIIQIFNRGEGVDNFDCQAVVFIEVKSQNKGGKFVEFSLPIQGYFFSYFPTGESEGLLYEIRGYRNNIKAFNLQNQFIEFARKQGRAYGVLQDNKYVKITYSDVLQPKITRSDYYDVSRGIGIKIDEKQGDKIFHNFEEANKNGKVVEFDTLTPDSLMREVDER